MLHFASIGYDFGHKANEMDQNCMVPKPRYDFYRMFCYLLVIYELIQCFRMQKNSSHVRKRLVARKRGPMYDVRSARTKLGFGRTLDTCTRDIARVRC